MNMMLLAAMRQPGGRRNSMVSHSMKDPQVGITVSIQVYPDAYSVCSRAVPERVEEDMFVHEFQLCPDIEKTIMVINEVMGCESKSYLLF